jgi:aminoglycoside phosphotransferase (APT) family kinase protein
MFTKPSLADLIDGITANAERHILPALDGSPAAQLLVDSLATLDRLAAEWSATSANLAADNADIGATLTRIGRPGQLDPPDRSDDVVDVAALAAENCRLKSALIAAIEDFDLPASSSDSDERRRIDGEVRELLARMLRREASAHPPTAPRQNPLSKAAAGLTPEVRETMSSALERFIRSQLGDADDVRVTNFESMAGGASREAFVFDASWTTPDGAVTERCVLLRQPVSSVLESDESATRFTGSRRVPEVEFQMLRCMEAAGVPVPHMLWLDPTGTVLERPFSVARLIDGEADHTKLPDAPHLEQVLAQYVQILAQVHTLDPASIGVDFLGDPTPETAASLQVEQFAEGVRRQQLEEFPALTYLIRWLRKHLPRAPRVSVVHGDFRLGNFMYDDTGILAMLDWEQTHLGDPVEELAFMYWPLWSLEPLVPIEDLVRRYEEASGITVDPQALAFYRAFIELKMSVVLLTGIRSFFATDERQVAYGASTALQMLCQCQLRFVDELLHDGPSMQFGADRTPRPT